MQKARGFTLIEIALSIFILLLLLVLAVPSFSGVIANRRLKQSLDEFNNLVRQAQTRSVTERRPYLIVWGKNNVVVRPEAFAEDEEAKAKAEFRPSKGSTLRLSLPVALTENIRLNGFSGHRGPANRQSSAFTVPLVHGRRIICR